MSYDPQDDAFIWDSRHSEIYYGETFWEGPDGHIYNIDSLNDLRNEQTTPEWAEENGFIKKTNLHRSKI